MCVNALKVNYLLQYSNVGCRIHWVLFVINPNAGDIYFLDPLDGEPSDHGSIKTKFEK
jgi:hypothetical protein